MLFSVCIPNYNSEKWSVKLMESIKAQTFTDYEVIIVDDISEDCSPSIIADYVSDNIHLYVNSRKRYNGGTRNVCVEKAKGEYILFIDCDDYFYSNTAFQTIADIIERDNHPDIVRLPYHYLVARGEGDVIDKIIRDDTPEKVMNNVFIAPWTQAIKRELFVEFPENTLIEDVSWHIEQIDKVETISVCPTPIVVWNCRNDKSISHPKNEGKSIKRQASYWRIIADLLELQGKLKHDYSEAHRIWRLNNYYGIAKEKLNGI